MEASYLFIGLSRYVIKIKYCSLGKNGYRKLVDGKTYIPSITNLYYGGHYFYNHFLFCRGNK